MTPSTSLNVHCGLLTGFLPGSDIEESSKLLKAIAHPVRLKILCILARGETSVKRITAQVESSQSNVSQHLSIMKSSGVIGSRRDANMVFYSITDDSIADFVEKQKAQLGLQQ